MATGTGNLPNQNMDFVPLAELPASDLDKLVENIESLADGTGIGDGSVSTPALNMTIVAPDIAKLIDDNTETYIASAVSSTDRSVSSSTFVDIAGCTINFTPKRSPNVLCIATFQTKFSGVTANKYIGWSLGATTPVANAVFLSPVAVVSRMVIGKVSGLTVGSANSIRLRWRTDAGEIMTIPAYEGVQLFITEI